MSEEGPRDLFTILCEMPHYDWVDLTKAFPGEKLVFLNKLQNKNICIGMLRGVYPGVITELSEREFIFNGVSFPYDCVESVYARPPEFRGLGPLSSEIEKMAC